jgi:hypothetical protein
MDISVSVSVSVSVVMFQFQIQFQLNYKEYRRRNQKTMRCLLSKDSAGKFFLLNNSRAHEYYMCPHWAQDGGDNEPCQPEANATYYLSGRSMTVAPGPLTMMRELLLAMILTTSSSSVKGRTRLVSGLKRIKSFAFTLQD